MDRQRTSRTVAFLGSFAVGAALAAWLAGARRRRAAARQLRYRRGRLRGWRYRLLGGHPVAAVSDDLLADRVRAVLGGTTKRLDLPHVHVTASRRIVLLHGDVGTDADADEIEDAAQRVPGVDGVLSYLHVGLAPGDSRPSEGSLSYAESPALQRLVAAARAVGLPDRSARAAVRAVLATFLERLPESQRAHLLAHLPSDVRVLGAPPRRQGFAAARVRRLDDFLDAVIATDHIEPTRVRQVSAAVLGTVRELVPEEVRQVAAVLPRDLRELWLAG